MEQAESGPQALVVSVGRDHVLSSYGENLRQQGAKLKQILTANDNDGIPENDLVLVHWPESDLALLKDATIQFLNARASDAKLSEQDRKDYGKILESLRKYVSSNNGYGRCVKCPTTFVSKAGTILKASRAGIRT